MKNKKFWINPNTQGIFLGDSTLLLKTKKPPQKKIKKQNSDIQDFRTWKLGQKVSKTFIQM